MGALGDCPRQADTGSSTAKQLKALKSVDKPLVSGGLLSWGLSETASAEAEQRGGAREPARALRVWPLAMIAMY
jgi:hypothetical protein